MEDIVEEPTTAPDEELNGVLVRRAFDEGGNLQLEVKHLGDVKVTEVVTVLRAAARMTESQLGL